MTGAGALLPAHGSLGMRNMPQMAANVCHFRSQIFFQTGLKRGLRVFVTRAF